MQENPDKKLSKAEKKLAKKLEKEKMLLQIRRDTLARELALDAETKTKIRDKWCSTLIDSKIPEMQDNLRYILHYMEKLVEAEGFRKLQFEAERDELEEKVALLARSHSSALDMLFGIYKKRVEDMQSTFDMRVSEKSSEAEKEFKEINEHESEIQENMQAMLFKMQMIKEEKEYAMNCNMFLKLDDERSKNKEIEENLRTKLQKKMEKRWGEIKGVLAKYEESTKDRKKEYLQLKAKDDADSKTIHQQMRKTQQMLGQLEELKNCLEDCYVPKETISLINDLREERSLFFSVFNSMKVIVEHELNDDQEFLKNLTYVSTVITEDLSKVVKKAEDILTLYRICMKFETQQEKVKPVGETLDVSKELSRSTVHIPKDIIKQLKNVPAEKLIVFASGNQSTGPKDYEILNTFWEKLGRVHLSSFALKKCIENMQKENAFLKKCLSCYMKEYSEKKLTKLDLVI